MEGLEVTMYWYVARCKTGRTKKLVSTLNKQVNMNAFIPKSERCFGRGETAEFIVKEIYPLTSEEQSLLEKLLDNTDTIKHTRGVIVDRRFVPTDGPLVGLEDMIKKVDKYRRFATLDTEILTGKLLVAIDY